MSGSPGERDRTSEEIKHIVPGDWFSENIIAMIRDDQHDSNRSFPALPHVWHHGMWRVSTGVAITSLVEQREWFCR